MDWIDDPSGRLAHDYESSAKGGNRFATILLYMSDLGERDGGETVFVKAWPNGQDEKDRVQLPEVSVSTWTEIQRSCPLFPTPFRFYIVGFGTASKVR